MSRVASFEVEKVFNLTLLQEQAVRLRGQDLIVTAGAGSGKTRTLVARYLLLLVEGLAPRQLAAITFTEKAAREMRTRVRSEITRQKSLASQPDEKTFWEELEAQMDSARIGTIHSLCAEILRANPVEAAIPPEFDVLDEGASAALRAQVTEDTLAWLVSQPQLQQLFTAFKIETIKKLVGFALARRLDLREWKLIKSNTSYGEQLVRRKVDDFVRTSAVCVVINELQRMQASGQLALDAGDALAAQLEELLLTWNDLMTALDNGGYPEQMRCLGELKRYMALNKGKQTSRAKAALKELRALYDHQINPWLDGSFDRAIESLAETIEPQVETLFERAIGDYQARLSRSGALDFDDLEAGALQLLRKPAIRRKWHGEIQSLLVDEFQDTNSRQRELVEAICAGQPGRLFVVGDSRQSIYRFRGANVSVFKDLQARIEADGGRKIDLDLTFRAHRDLLAATGDLLEKVMAPEEEPAPDYWIKFSPLQAERQACEGNLSAPHLEWVIGQGEDAAAGRAAAARGLTARLLELKTAGQIQRWQEVALLFRASTGFSVYEDAFEAAGIPFVTIAGRGFYDRPEIRDVLNLLRAVSDPWDDLAVAGLLRSPAFGLPDAALYRLRFPHGYGKPVHLWKTLSGDLLFLPPPEQAAAQRAFEFLHHFIQLANRLPVADLLKQMVDYTNYRAILATAGSRLWRNVDKLLIDARKSHLVQVRGFLEYLETLRDVGAREGEADVEAEGSVQLMTIHKSKGLEFPIVVLADGSYQSLSRSENAYLISNTGLGLKLDRSDITPLKYRIIKLLDQDQETAESKRLLYVAATRAKEKLILSAHLSNGKSTGWLKAMAEAAGISLEGLASEAGRWHSAPLPCGQSIGVWIAPEGADPLSNTLFIQGKGPLPITPLPDSHLPSGGALYLPLICPAEMMQGFENEPIPLDQLPERPWRATGSRHAPAVVVGEMVHRAIQRWMFSDDPDLDHLLETMTLNAGLVETEQRIDAVCTARKLLERLRNHPIWEAMNLALERHHEVPYARTQNGKIDTGYIDMLYRTESGWVLVDFKTDTLRSYNALSEAIRADKLQIERYNQAALALLQVQPEILLVFLDFEGRLYVHKHTS